MVETPRLFAAAFFGYVPQESDEGVDPFALMREAAPRLCEDLPFLLAIREENIIGASGYLFCIVPADENATVAVNRRLWNAETETYEDPEVLYRSERGTPIPVMCPNDNWMPDTEVVITDSNGNVAVWYPHMDSSYSVAPLCNDNGESLIFDFTSYDELPNPGWNVQDRELLVIPGELYPGCGIDQWIAEVTEESGDTVHYALTLLEDGTLLLQTGWEMDGTPMVSYGWYRRVS